MNVGDAVVGLARELISVDLKTICISGPYRDTSARVIVEELLPTPVT